MGDRFLNPSVLHSTAGQSLCVIKVLLNNIIYDVILDSKGERPYYVKNETICCF